MNIKGLVLALAAGLSISTAAQAGVTVHNGDFLGATGNSNGFEAIGGTFYNGAAGYTEGGVKVQYVGRELTTLTTLNPVGKHSWTPLGGGSGYTKISLADGGDFSAIEFLAGGSNWFGNAKLQYQLFQDGALVFSGFVNGLGNIASSSLKTIGFSGTDGQLFDELRVQSISGNKFNKYGYDQLILDNITISAPLSSAVPEPATWAMMIIGFGAVGSMVRTSRRRQAYAFA
ncbi:MAG: PEPxxWA-CTERM sorting domain-containing protein [Pseudomonadota bacterium]|uniref:PEPxxWA-CTERM sorting domain-containing protein n=1 Tax=Phenylobacterium sp. TaxID=1871053 RepID=UPI002723BE74|nr:PEPxxWA-CTERM sorting domain-containing protein [Phenylobacterium sp.]MDO9430307.1 PEPxxWA-CTERM sorting domain-containing protein [Phenylobacterium sp.]